MENPGWPRLRVGVNTGDAVIREMGGDGFVVYQLVGDAINTASRLEGAGVALHPGAAQENHGVGRQPPRDVSGLVDHHPQPGRVGPGQQLFAGHARLGPAGDLVR